VVVTGCTTSGCVRASVVDAMSHNFRTVVARDCVGDRALGPHEANLFDMAQKYADVLDRDEIMAALERRASSPF
jgi:maleamate amidohydrolase